ncbi:type I polyketide synthase [Streptomyces sp. NPDC101145]|uniref:type I polyketide synthase n=1 Tax=Streptomyces sp. NPDC101145 TaxID=3366112 RepID=UPI00382CBC1F
MVTYENDATAREAVAVIGMACRFPGAPDPETFWRNLAAGVESLTRRDPEPVPGSRADGTTEWYTPARGLLDDPEWFDARHFGYAPREARLISPQHRLFLECAADALESAGQDPSRSPLVFGVFGGGTDIGYAQTLREHRAELPSVTDWEILLGSAPDYLVSRVAYKLGLTGPAVTVQTACSTALVAVHTAVRSLLAGECDVALAGAAAVHVPAKESQYTPGGIISARGECRAFDASADGTVGGDGVGVVVLKRLADAHADGDHVLAVVRGTAVNNDGAHRVGYTAPSVAGQAAVIRAAQLAAGVDAGTIGYVEAHGTATPVGDPIELTALTEAFRQDTDRTGYCWIGSVKTNIGHTDAAAGAAGLIKTVLALQHGHIPPSLHFDTPNPQFDFDASPFRVAARPTPWPADGGPRRAGVSAFGIGGTNAHVVLEEAPPPPPSAPADDRPAHLLVLSADTPAALDATARRLADRIRADRPDGAGLADIAWTLQTGRRERARRAYAVVRDADDAVAVLEGRDAARLVTTEGRPGPRATAFLFSGGAGLAPNPERYRAEPAYREAVDACRAAAGLTGDARDDLLGAGPGTAPERARLAAFTHEYARAMTWIRCGVRPDTVLGAGTGALVAAAVAKVLTVEDAVRLLLDHAHVLPGTPPATPGRTAPEPDADGAADTDEAVTALAAALAGVPLGTPRVPVLSAAHGRPLTDEEAADPAQWARAALTARRADEALSALLGAAARTLLDASADGRLLAAARTRPEHTDEHLLLPAPAPAAGGDPDGPAAALDTLGRLWLGGASVRWRRVHGGTRRTVPLPTYPYERERHLVGPSERPAAPPTGREQHAHGERAGTAPRPEDTARGHENPAPPQAPDEGTPEVLPTLMGLYAEILGLPEVTATDNFFDLGGDSLVAARLTERIREVFPVDVDVLSVFEAPEPAELAATVEELLAS